MKKEESLKFTPIGIIQSPYSNVNKAPYQGSRSDEISRIEIFEEFEGGLQDIEGFSHIIIIYWFHKAQGFHLLVITPWDDIPHGVFTTRPPIDPVPWD
jgi:tRNA-Thr(GGU) m(6)t(6)A37 methyltransferase TsaA